MRYSIAFKNLPFEPERRQVIYVENLYDERINAIIREKYDWLKWNFKRANLDFVYLPMFFNDEEIKEKVLYYAPYLTSEIMEKVELRSSYLLGYMSHIENKVKIQPSFLYAPQKEDDEWVFQGQTIDLSEKEDLAINKWFEDSIYDIEEELPIIRRCIRFDKDEEPSAMTGKPASSDSKPEYSSTPILDILKKEHLRFEKIIVEEEDGISTDTAKSTLEEIRDEDVSETVEDLDRIIERLRLLGIPLNVIVEYVAKYETISRLRLTDDLGILLPDYNNREVKMGPLYKAVYFLFLNHPEGIILQHLENYHHELVNYYLQTSQKDELTPRMVDTINRLEYPGDNTINTVLTRIKTYFKATIDEHLAKHYCIVGKPGEPYKIPLDPNLIEWEDDYE
jgi:hypothetical protein